MPTPSRPAHSCRRCEPCTRAALHALPGLYAGLGDAVTPGTGARLGRSTGRAASPAPLRLAVVDLTAEVPAVLGAWVSDWAGYGRATPGRSVSASCRTLSFNLSWAAEAHPAYEDFAREIHHLTDRVREAVTGESTGRPVHLPCTCGTVLSVRLDTPARLCPGCGQHWTWSQLIALAHMPTMAAA